MFLTELLTIPPQDLRPLLPEQPDLHSSIGGCCTAQSALLADKRPSLAPAKISLDMCTAVDYMQRSSYFSHEHS